MYKILFAVFLLSCSFTIAAENVNSPVMVGNTEDLDACPSLGEVSGLKQGGDGFLAVRAGHTAKAALVDKLQTGQKVFICSTSKDGKWLGVVYSRKNNYDCDVGTAISPPQPYKGKCRSGWVSAHWIKVIAG